MLSVGQRKTRPRFRILACAERERRKKPVAEETGLTVKGYLSGSLGGNLEIGAQVAEKQIDIVFFGIRCRRNHPEGSSCRMLAHTKENPQFPVTSGIVAQ